MVVVATVCCHDEDFVQESESLRFLPAILLSVHQRRTRRGKAKERGPAQDRRTSWFDVISLHPPRLNVLWKPNRSVGQSARKIRIIF